MIRIFLPWKQISTLEDRQIHNWMDSHDIEVVWDNSTNNFLIFENDEDALLFKIAFSEIIGKIYVG